MKKKMDLLGFVGAFLPAVIWVLGKVSDRVGEELMWRELDEHIDEKINHVLETKDQS